MFKDFRAGSHYDYKYHWYLTDREAKEFLTCDNCRTEAPLHKWDNYTGSNRWLCEICSNAPFRGEIKPIAAVANLVLTQMGKFDNVAVVEPEEYSLDDD